MPRALTGSARDGQVFAYGRFECDSPVAYQGVVALGRITVEGVTGKETSLPAIPNRWSPADNIKSR